MLALRYCGLHLITHEQGSKLSDKVLEMSAEKLIETFVQGELFISDWSPDKGANIKVIKLFFVGLY